MFTGMFDMKIQRGNRILIPEKFRPTHPANAVEDAFGRVWVAAPIGARAVYLYVWRTFAEVVNVDRASLPPSSVVWSEEVQRLLREHHLREAIPLYAANADEELRDLMSSVRRELHQYQSKRHAVTGKDFEDAVASVLRSLGITIQQRIRIGGGEADMWGLSYSSGGRTRSVLIECKHQSESGQKVDVQQVRSFFGLWEIVSRQIDVTDAFLVSSTGFTQAAKETAKILKIRVGDFAGLREWAESCQAGQPSARPPIFRVGSMKASGDFPMPAGLLGYLGLMEGSEAVLIGVMNRLELREREEWLSSADQRFAALADLRKRIEKP